MHCTQRSVNISKSRALSMLTILSALSFGACSDEPGASGQSAPSQNQDVLDYITSLSSLVLPAEDHSEVSTSNEEVRNIPAAVNVCTYTEISETSHFDNLVSFDPNADALWPGALVQGQSLSLGLLSPIGGQRAPGTVTLTNARIDGAEPSEFVYSRPLASPSLASAQDAIQEILTAESVQFAAKMAYKAHQANSLQEASLKAGISAQFVGNSLETAFGKDWMQSETTFLIDFTQAYYTVSFEAPPEPSAFFAPSTTVNELKPFMFEGNPPGYVSSVTYGRRLLVKFESAESSEKVSAALDATFSWGVSGGDFSLSLEEQQTLQNTKMTLLALGGSADSAVSIIEPDQGGDEDQDKAALLQGYFQEGANFSPASVGVPLSYTVRYLSNYQPLAVASANNYTVRSCVEKNSKITVQLDKLNIYENGEWIGDGEINYEIYVDGQLVPGASGYGVKRGDGTNILLSLTHELTLPQQDGKSFAVHAKIWEHNKQVLPSITHTFNADSEEWSPMEDQQVIGENGNLKVGLLYNVTAN